MSWEEIAIDTVGPWTVSVHPVGSITFNAHTIVDTCANLLEARCATQHNPTGLESAQVLEETWLSRHPQPVRCIFDQGTEWSPLNPY